MEDIEDMFKNDGDALERDAKRVIKKKVMR